MRTIFFIFSLKNEVKSIKDSSENYLKNLDFSITCIENEINFCIIGKYVPDVYSD